MKGRFAFISLCLALLVQPTAEVLFARDAFTFTPDQIAQLKMAAEKGDAAAQFVLGLAFDKGDGVPQDGAAAARWYRKSAEQGEARGQTALGTIYFKGHGVDQDDVQAARWYRKAAEQGQAVAQESLGGLYAVGRGVSKDYVLAYMWDSLAAAQGQTLAAKNRDALARDMTAAQIAVAQLLASKFVPRKSQSQPSTGLTVDRKTADSPPKATGSSFGISSNGYILTAAHVVADARRVTIETSRGFKPVKIIRVDTTNDVALLKLEGRIRPLPVASSRGVKLGADVFTIGFPNIAIQGSSPKLTRGNISSLKGFQDDPREFQISVAIQPGNSGGPLVDDSGNVIGIVASRLSDASIAEQTGMLPQNVNYAVKSDYFLPMLHSIEELAGKLREPNKAGTLSKDECAKEVDDSTGLILVY